MCSHVSAFTQFCCDTCVYILSASICIVQCIPFARSNENGNNKFRLQTNKQTKKWQQHIFASCIPCMVRFFLSSIYWSLSFPLPHMLNGLNVYVSFSYPSKTSSHSFSYINACIFLVDVLCWCYSRCRQLLFPIFRHLFSHHFDGGSFFRYASFYSCAWYNIKTIRTV